MFTGEYRHSVDDKGRVAIPARFRAQLDDGAVVTRWIDGCAAVFPRAAFELLASRVAALPLSDTSARTINRFLFASAFDQPFQLLFSGLVLDRPLRPGVAQIGCRV